MRNFNRILKRVLNETLEGKADEVMEKLYGNQKRLDKVPPFGKLTSGDFKKLRSKKSRHEVDEDDVLDFNPSGESFDYIEEEEGICECGGEMREGECSECGMKSSGTIYELEIEDEEETLYEVQLDETSDIDEEEMGEGNAFSGALEKAKKEGKKSFKVDGKTYPVKESVLFTEGQLIDLIEEVVKKEKDNIKKGKTHPGLSVYEKSHKGSGKEETKYMDSFMKKMKDYLKDGSKGKFETEPKHFPKGNGQLAKMDTKKYTMSDDGKEFLDDYMHPGMENLVPDEIEYDEKWVNDNIKGSSRTGNNPEWANAEETELGEKISKKMKDRKYHKAKLAAYRKSKQPVTDGVGENAGQGVNIKLESKETKKLNEEFDRMKNLISYDRKTQ
jgi:hypothetical protein